MNERYDAPLETTVLTDGRTVYKTARPTAIQATPGDMSVTMGAPDRFDVIAQNAYGTAAEWWRIASANGNVNGSLTVPIGTVVVIPQK